MGLAILERINQLVQSNRTKGNKLVKISDYLETRFITFIDEEDRDKALLKLVDVLAQSGKLKDKKAFYQALLQREKIVSTGIGMGVAIPHAKLSGYDEFFIAIGIQRHKGIEWDSLDKTSVRLIFMIGGPENEQAKYLQLLSKITTFIRDSNLRKNILQTNSAKEILQLLEGY